MKIRKKKQIERGEIKSTQQIQIIYHKQPQNTHTHEEKK